MYTQCPECDVAFRVTAEVLRQAAGKVRCGGCGIAFNALEHLSEEKPQAPVRKEPEAQLPELTPEPQPELEADTPPKSISAEQSAALLKTLDQLAGSDIRIEDTGIEWRVLDADPEAESGPEEEPAADTSTDTGSLRFFIEEESDEAEIVEEMRFDDNTPLPDDFDSDEASISAAEPGPVVVEEAQVADDLEDAQVDLVFGEADEWEDLLGDIDEAKSGEEPEPEPVIEDRFEEENFAEADDLVLLGGDEASDAVDRPLDMDTQFAIQAEAMGIDLSGLHASVDDEEKPDNVEEGPDVDEDEPETSIDEDLIAAAFETEAAQEAVEDVEEELEELEELEDEFEQEPEEDAQDELGDDIEEELEENLDEEVEAELDDDIEEEIKEELEDEVGDTDPSDEHVVPEMTEEELTINMMIDQDLLSVAVEDEDGFASTIVQKQPDKKVEGEIGSNKNPAKPKKAEPLFETIVMEGESVSGELEREKLSRDRTAQNRESALQSIRSKRDSDKSEYRERNWPSIGMVAGALVLLLLLAFQFMHQSREALATIPAFNNAVGPAYRALGKPLTPTWDISGWRIEQTTGSLEDTEQLLTIYSRIANRSDKALPYPLVHLSLTDRFEDIVGSRVLDPGEYLASNADPRKPVAPGNTFFAVMSIDTPSAEATGFKLNVCYRLASGDLRCAIEDFR